MVDDGPILMVNHGLGIVVNGALTGWWLRIDPGESAA
jgi:hypothetical protein